MCEMNVIWTVVKGTSHDSSLRIHSHGRNRHYFSRLTVALILLHVLTLCSGCGVTAGTQGKSVTVPVQSQTISAFSCVSTSILEAGTDVCTVNLVSASSTTVSVALSSNSPSVIVPATLSIPAYAFSAQFTATAVPVPITQMVTIQAILGGASASYSLTLDALSQLPFSYTGSTVSGTYAPPTPSVPISNNLFGMTVVNLAPNSSQPAPNMTPFPSFPVSTLRFWDVVYWQMIQPNQTTWNWPKLDNSIAIAQAGGVSDFIFTFGRTPQWASTNPTDPCTTNNGQTVGEGAGTCTFPILSDFETFATTLVQRYCGVIKYYETWNEPSDPIFWDGTNAQMAAIAQQVNQIVKNPANCGCTNGVCSVNGGVNPNKVIFPPVNGVTTATVAWLQSYLASVGPTYPYADITSFHGYGYQAAPETILTANPTMQQFEQTLSTYGLGSLPLWNTETSWEYDTYLTQPQQASFTMRYPVMMDLMGVPRTIWYAYDDCSWGTLYSSPLCATLYNVPVEGTVGTDTNAGTAYGTIETWMINADLTQCQAYANGLWVCNLQRAGGYNAWMLWTSNGSTLTVPVPTTLGLTTYRDWQNNLNALSSTVSVGQLPILLENFDSIY